MFLSFRKKSLNFIGPKTGPCVAPDKRYMSSGSGPDVAKLEKETLGIYLLLIIVKVFSDLTLMQHLILYNFSRHAIEKP